MSWTKNILSRQMDKAFVSHVVIWKQRHLWILLIFWSSIKKGNQGYFRFGLCWLKLNFLMHYLHDTSKNTIKVSSWTYVHNCRICEWKSGLWIRVGRRKRITLKFDWSVTRQDGHPDRETCQLKYYFRRKCLPLCIM